MITNWKVWVPSRGGTEAYGCTVGGHDAMNAAENLAEHMCRVDPANYATFQEEGLTMHARALGDEKATVHALHVTGRMRMEFRAEKTKAALAKVPK